MERDPTFREAEDIFRKLNPVNRQYAMGVLQSLAFAQRTQEGDLLDPHTEKQHSANERVT